MSETLIILEKLNSFYSNAWSQLVIYTTTLFLVIGILIPLLVQFYQRKIQKVEKEEIRKTIAGDLKKIKEELYSAIDANLKQKTDYLEKKIASSEGKSFHILGKNYAEQNLYHLALDNFTTAASFYLKGEDETNLRRALTAICTNCLPYITKNELLSSQRKLKRDLENLVEKLKEENINGRYADSIDNIECGIELAEKREPSPPTTN